MITAKEIQKKLRPGNDVEYTTQKHHILVACDESLLERHAT